MGELGRQLRGLDGATLEWRGYSISHGACLWRVTGLPPGVGYVYMAATYFINFPPIMHDIRIRLATNDETEDLRHRLPGPGESLRQREYRFVECKEGIYAVWSKGFCVIWDEVAAARMLRDNRF